MRARKLFVGGALVLAGLFGATGVAAAAELGQTEEPTAEEHSGEQSHLSECIIEAEKAGTEAEKCLEAPNPILPEPNEIIWGGLSFLILFLALQKWAFPAMKTSMEARTNKIRDSLDEAESTRAEASSILDEYQRQLADARNESARIIEEARQTADAMRRDLISRAEAEANETKQRAIEDINVQADRIKADLQAQVSQLSIDLAEKIVGGALDRDRQMQLIENYINEVNNQR